MQDTFTVYTRLMIQLVFFLIRQKSQSPELYHLPFLQPVEDAVWHLIEQLRLLYHGEQAITEQEEIAIVDAIHSLLFSVLTHIWPTSADNQFPDPIIRFVMHTQLNQDLSFKQPHEVTGILAKLTYNIVCLLGCSRSVVLI